MSALANRIGCEWPHIFDSQRFSDERHSELSLVLEQHTTEDTSVVVFGSFARQELTAGSDLDWILLVDGIADSAHLDAARAIESSMLEGALNKPGSEGTFGGLVFSHDLIHYIGGEDDTNRNLTQRMLVLLESASIGRSDAYARVINNVIKRYVVEDFGWMHSRNPINFLVFFTMISFGIGERSLWTSRTIDVSAVARDGRSVRIGRTASELTEIFELLPRARLCFDIAHARQYDSSLTEAYRILHEHGDSVCQIHISDVSSGSRHDRLSSSSVKAYREISAMLRMDAPAILETPVSASEMSIELARARLALRGEPLVANSATQACVTM